MSHRQAIERSEGWKLHVSAGRANAGEVLQRVLPVLLHQTASFKIAASPEALDRLNQGRKSPSQIGKFITAYANDDAQAVCLALALESATRGLPAPPFRLTARGDATPGALNGARGYFMADALSVP